MNRVEGLLRRREQAIIEGDWGIVRACDHDLATYGHRVEAALSDTRAPEPAERAVPAVPERRGPGRPRKNPL